MPAGLPWPKYLAFVSAAMFTMFMGSQMVHIYYRPLDDIEQYIERERRIAEIIKDKHSS